MHPLQPFYKVFDILRDLKESENEINKTWDAYMEDVNQAAIKYAANLCLPANEEYLALHSTGKTGADIL